MAEPGTPGAPPPPEAFDPAALNRQALEVMGRLNDLPREGGYERAETARHIMADAIVAAGARADRDGALLLPRDIRILAVETEDVEGADPTVVIRLNERATDPVALRAGHHFKQGETRVPATEFRARYQDPYVEAAGPDETPLTPYRTVNFYIFSRGLDPPEGPRSGVAGGGDIPPRTRARLENERQGAAIEVLDRITPETDQEEEMHIIAEAVVAANGLADQDGVLLMPENFTITGAYTEPGEDDAAPRAMLVVRRRGETEDHTLPITGFRTRYQDPFDHADGSRELWPYRAANGIIAARLDDGPDGPRSVTGTGSDLPPPTRAKFLADRKDREETLSGDATAEAGGERVQSGLPTNFERTLLNEAEPLMGAVVYREPTTSEELRELLEILEPEELTEVVDGAVDRIGWTLDENPGRFLAELEVVSEWSPDFRHRLRHELAGLPQVERMGGLSGYELDFSRGRPPIVRHITEGGRRVNPWELVRSLRREVPRAEWSNSDGEVLTVQAIDNAVDRAFLFAWGKASDRLRSES